MTLPDGLLGRIARIDNQERQLWRHTDDLRGQRTFLRALVDSLQVVIVNRG